MEKEVNLFDKRFVYFMWNDELEGKECFVSNDIINLKGYVEYDTNRMFHEVTKGHCNHPFAVVWKEGNLSDEYRFAYYDPNYEVKKAFKEGKKIQYRVKGFVDWDDYTNQNPCWDDEDREWRVKPECPCEDCNIGFRNHVPANMTPEGYTLTMSGGYANSECPCEEGIDSKACAGCPQDEERKQTFRPFKDCEELVEFWSKNYQTGFRPANTKPLVNIKKKNCQEIYFITGFDFDTECSRVFVNNEWLTLDELFNNFEFVDRNIIGVLSEE